VEDYLEALTEEKKYHMILMVTYSNFTINLGTFRIIRTLELDNKRDRKRN